MRFWKTISKENSRYLFVSLPVTVPIHTFDDGLFSRLDKIQD